MAAVLDAFVERCISTLADVIKDRVVMVLEVKDEMEKLQRRLRRISCVLKEAERRRIQDSAINNWLDELKDVMYDADDIFDICRVEGGKLLGDPPSTSSTPPVRCQFPFFSCFRSVQFRHEVGSRIRELNKRLEELSSDKLMLDLEGTATSRPVDPADSCVDSRQTSSLVELDIVGSEIDDATKDLVDLLTREGENGCRICAITGMGGIGKTTLAQKVFNESKIKDLFQVRVWVCVSQKFSAIDLLKQILRGGGMRYGKATTKAELQPMLRDAVRGKRFFLVLDDVWQAGVWLDLLRNPIQSGVSNAIILVTTRDENVAYRMGSDHIHKVRLLSDHSGWELLQKKAFINEGEEEIENLKDIGLGIVSKCKGLPLAITVVGSLLATKEKSRREWEKVANSDAWSRSELPEELRGALYLSYEDLPSHLKQCFLYCSLFPEDLKFYRLNVARLWVAEGFVQSQGDSKSILEDLAEEYFDELLRSLFQPAPDSVMKKPCVMHDLLHSLAQFLSRHECFYGDVEEMKTAPGLKLRRLSIAAKGERVVIPDSLINKKSLRTLIILKTPPVIEDSLIARLLHLRVLILIGGGVKSIPDSIGNLIHLRYLDLQRTDISCLPESIERLTNMLTLDLMECKYLKSLPRGITRLCNLRRLGLYNVPLCNVPKGIGRLEHLNDISGFIAGDQDNGSEGSDLEELNSLLKLRKLSIFKLERASTGASVLFNKSHLTRLSLRCTPYSQRKLDGLPYIEEDISGIERIFNNLSPPPHLEEELWIDGFFGCVFPSWMMSSLKTSLTCLTRLFLFNCELCQQLPPLGQLPQLKYLHIKGESAVVSIGHEFLRGKAQRLASNVVFAKLQIFWIEEMPNWETWSLTQEFKGNGDADDAKGSEAPQLLLQLPRLEELVIRNCPKLRALPIDPQHVDNYSIDNNDMQRVQTFPALSRLTIHNCPVLQCVENLDALKNLELMDESIVSLPLWLLQLVQGQQCKFKMDIFCNLHALERCLDGGPEWPIIQQIPAVNIYADTKNGQASLHYVKDPFYYRMTNLPGGKIQ